LKKLAIFDMDGTLVTAQLP